MSYSYYDSIPNTKSYDAEQIGSVLSKERPGVVLGGSVGIGIVGEAEVELSISIKVKHSKRSSENYLR